MTRDTIERLRKEANLRMYERAKAREATEEALAKFDAADRAYREANEALSIALGELAKEEPECF